MPQRISDEELRDKLAIYLCMPAPDALLDLRDARAEIAQLKKLIETQSARTNVTRNALHEQHAALTLAVEGLELVADQNDAAYPKQIAQTYLERIKGIG